MTTSLSAGPHRLALDNLDGLAAQIAGRRLAVFLDYDGTLTPIVSRPGDAVLSDAMRGAVETLARACPVAVVSGRARPDVEALMGIASIAYAGSHGFDIVGPGGQAIETDVGAAFVSSLGEAAESLSRQFAGIDGALVENKVYAVAVHYRLVTDQEARQIEKAVDVELARHPNLKKTGGKKVFELRPAIDWHKGKAVLKLLEVLGDAHTLPLYIGDDVTDEDAFEALKDIGIGVLVAEEDRPSAAHYRVRDTEEVRLLLLRLTELAGG